MAMNQFQSRDGSNDIAASQRSSQPDVKCNADTADAVGKPSDVQRWPMGLTCQAHDLVNDGEIIILQTRPSIIYIILASLGSLFAIAFLVVCLAYISRVPYFKQSFASWSELDSLLFGFALVIIRLGWQFLDWWCRLYVLTDRRIITVQGVIRRSYYQAPLRQIQHLAVVQSVRERVTWLGSIAFATAGSDRYDTIWLMLRRPFEVYKTINQTIERYRGHGPNNGNK